MNKFALIVAGGKGLRMGSEIPKQFLPLLGRPVLMHTLQVFSKIPNLEIVLVLPANDVPYWNQLVAEHNFTIPHKLVYGGSSRFQSVANGLKSLEGNQGFVAIHDGVRPLVEHKQIEEGFVGAANYGNAVLAVRLKDSIRKVELLSNHSVNRNNYYLIQTPQTFQLQQITDAYSKADNDNFTDDAAVLEAATGEKIHLIEGDYRNIKITTVEDLKIAECFLIN